MLSPRNCVRLFIALSIWALVVSTACTVALASAPEVKLSLQPRSGSLEDEFVLKVAVSDTSDSLEGPSFEASEKFEFEALGTAIKQYFINGHSESNKTFSFRIILSPSLAPGTYQLPDGYFINGTQRISFKLPSLTILPTSEAIAENTKGSELSHKVSKESPFVGEQILYETRFRSQAKIFGAELTPIELTGFWRESFGEAGSKSYTDSNASFQVLTLRESLFPTTAGTLGIPARRLTASLQVPSSYFDKRYFEPFAQRLPSIFDMNVFSDAVRKNFVAPAISLSAKPLPPPPVSGLSYTPVGKVKLASSVDKVLIRSNQSATMTVELYGDANLRPYEIPESRDDNFKVYADKPEIEAFLENDRVFFKKKFTFALIPQKTGELTVPRFDIVVFDPESASYEILKTPSRSVVVDAVSSDEHIDAKSSTSGAGVVDARQEKRAVKVLGEDLLPQRVSDELYRETRPIENRFIVIVFVVVPILAFSVCVFAEHWLRVSADPNAALRRRAQSIAMQDIEALKDTRGDKISEELSQIARTYLANKFSCKCASMTPSEIERLISVKLSDHKLATNVAQYLAKLERLRFSNALGADESGSDIVGEARVLINELDKHI